MQKTSETSACGGARGRELASRFFFRGGLGAPPQWEALPKVVFLDRTQQRTVVHNSAHSTDPRVVKDLADTLSGEGKPSVTRNTPSCVRKRDHESEEWGLGDTKLLLHKTTDKIRFMLRDEITVNIVLVLDDLSYFRLAPGM